MKKVEKLISKEEYIEKVTPLIREEVLKGVLKSKSKLPKRVGITSRASFRFVAFLLKVAGLSLVITAIYFLFVWRNKNVPEYEAQKVVIFFVLGAILWVVGFIMSLMKKKGIRKLGVIFGENMDQQKIYEIAINSFPNFSLYDINYDEIRNGLYEYNHQIPSDATISSFSPSFLVKYKDKYIVQFQSAQFNWTRTVQDKDGSYEEVYYENSSFIQLEGDKNNTDFLYTMKQRSLLKKIELENKEFLRLTKYRSNNEIKSRMAFTPLAMEEIVKHLLKTPAEFKLTKQERKYVFSAITTEDCYVIKAQMGKTIEQTVQNFINDIISDFYHFYEVIGVAIIPPML
ncbi:hypothetical protein [Mycoplasma todarodis]|uniref:hypothetical protein n=1 Tax=Mycoplasma todarodis TaxID=1937191 RepID=UPI003B35A691